MDERQQSGLKNYFFQVGGFCAVAVLIHLLQQIFLTQPVRFLVPGILCAGAVYFGFVTRQPAGHPKAASVRLGVAFVLAGIALTLGSSTGGGRVQWTPYSEGALNAAAAEKRPVIIDFTADWCPNCRALERTVFSEPSVERALDQFVRLRVDLSDRDSTAAQVVTEKFAVLVLPAVVFIGPDGTERTALRLTGVESPGAFLLRAEAAQ